MSPLHYFVLNHKTQVMHIQGYCPQTKVRGVPIRLFDTPQELEQYAGRKLKLCRLCHKNHQKES